MSPIAMAMLVICFYLVFYHFYAKGLLGKKVFELDDNNITPAHTFNDGIDYVPSNKYILFGHHYASIAGLAPMLGPAIAVIWGWLPALCWVVFGTLLIGAVHDFTALILSSRHQGHSVGTIAKEVISPRTRLLFLLVIFFLVALAMGVFVLVISGLFAAPDVANIAPTSHPEAVFPTYALMLIAMVIGFLVYKKNLPMWPLIGLGFVLMLLTTWWGLEHPITGFTAKEWTWSLLIYAFAASVLPVWLLLQPRDFLNSLLLYLAIFMMLIGFFLLDPEWAAPAINPNPVGAPPMLPFLFIVIACGAVSGFHGIVASGTTAKQLDKESDAPLIGYGGMIGESLLALLAVLATTAGAFATRADWEAFYGSWDKAVGLHQKLGVFIQGNANFIHQLGVPVDYAAAFISVVVVGFAMTSVDTGARLLRFNIQEIGKTIGMNVLNNRCVATFLAVSAIGFFAFFELNGKPAGLFLWTLFGTTNQILAGLTLLTVTIYLYRKKKPILYTLLPMLLVLGTTIAGMIMGMFDAVGKEQWTVAMVGFSIFSLAVWVLIEALIVVKRIKDERTNIDL
ncbi:MAG: carbon starvation protein A [Zetaproteobacteria bacterium CG2_30_46_52]|nr:MAG: carbon starvation protein A [Zetaproteobacteria bacterium CG2_30_46_52]